MEYFLASRKKNYHGTKHFVDASISIYILFIYYKKCSRCKTRSEFRKTYKFKIITHKYVVLLWFLHVVGLFSLSIFIVQSVLLVSAILNPHNLKLHAI